jgi:hypothetical protein
MATAAKFAGAEREKLFAQLEVPFDPAQIKWRVMRTSDDRRSGAILPFADPRAYTDRLNQLFTPAGWTREYTISTVPSLTRMDRGKVIVTSKLLVATAVTISRLGSHTGTGEEWADRENAVTAADAQAFKRACSCFGLGRYLYRFEETWVHLNGRGEPVAIPILPEWALPPGVTMAPANGQAVDVRGPVDHKLTADIEGFRNTLGEPIYAEILRRAGHSSDSRTIPNADRQKNVVEWMQAATRGFERLHVLVDMVGDATFIAVMDNLKIASITSLPSLAALKQLVEELEAITGQQVA